MVSNGAWAGRVCELSKCHGVLLRSTKHSRRIPERSEDDHLPSVVNCKFLIGEECKLAASMCGHRCETSVEACRACVDSASPMAANHVTASLAIAASRGRENFHAVLDANRQLLKPSQPAANPHPSGCLAGTELKKLFGTFGLKPKAKCNCNKHARKMDEAGCDWCEQHIDRIAGWIKHECRKMGIPFVKPVVVAAIHLAISRARKNQASGEPQTEPQRQPPTD